jgi:hypothetical protein
VRQTTGEPARDEAEATPGGEWRALSADWACPAFVACGLCGRPLFGRAWSAAVDGEQTDFCDPDCEELLHEYWLPRHRATVTEKG